MGLLREKIEYRSARTDAELVNDLGLAVGRKGQSRASTNIGFARDFEGVVSNQGFRINRVPQWGYNGFIPECSGTFKNENGGTTVYADIRLTKYVRLFLILFFLFGLMLVLPSLSNLWTTAPAIDPQLDEILKETLPVEDYEKYKNQLQPSLRNSFVWSALRMYLIVFGVIVVIFKYESNRLRTWLNGQFG